MITMEYSPPEKNKILSFVATDMELEDIILSEISQAQREKYHVFACRQKHTEPWEGMA
jgi:hypothetical protein